MAISLALFYFFEEGSLLSVDLSLLVALLIFLVALFLMNALIFKPITNVLDERERITSGAMADARHALREYEHRLTGYEEQIRAARAESYQMLEAQRNAALGERSKMLAEIKQEAGKKIEAKKLEIEKAASEARRRLEADAQVMAASISSNLLKRPLGGSRI